MATAKINTEKFRKRLLAERERIQTGTRRVRAFLEAALETVEDADESQEQEAEPEAA